MSRGKNSEPWALQQGRRTSKDAGSHLLEPFLPQLAVVTAAAFVSGPEIGCAAAAAVRRRAAFEGVFAWGGALAVGGWIRGAGWGEVR